MANHLQKLLGLASCAAVLLAAEVTIAAPAKWVRIMTDSSKNIWYVDASSIQGRGRYRFFWSFIENQNPVVQNGRSVYSAIFYLSVDCQEQRYRLRFEEVFDQNSRSIGKQSYGEDVPLADPRPGSGEAASIRYVCLR